MTINVDFYTTIDDKQYRCNKLRVYRDRDGNLLHGVELIDEEGNVRTLVVVEDVEVINVSGIISNEDGTTFTQVE